MSILQDYLETNASKGIIDFRFRATPVNGAVHIYIHPLGVDGETVDFYAKGNTLIDKAIADKVSDDPGAASHALLAPFVAVAKGIPDNWPGECILRFDQRSDGSIYLSYHGINDASHGITINQWRALLGTGSANSELAHAMSEPSKSPSSAVWCCVQRFVRRLSEWALRDELKLQKNVNEDAQALVDALQRGERADAYCGYGRDGQASNYRDELKWSLYALKKSNTKRTDRHG